LIPKKAEIKPKTLGQHVHRRRIELGLSQRAAGLCLGVNVATVLNWEKGRTKPATGAMPGLMRWLGYNPLPAPKSLQERMVAARRTAGWTIAEAARHLGVDAATWGDWERKGRVPWRRFERRLESLLEALLNADAD
jgi:DNA-binding transcriptional regulator YiaG